MTMSVSADSQGLISLLKTGKSGISKEKNCSFHICPDYKLNRYQVVLMCKHERVSYFPSDRVHHDPGLISDVLNLFLSTCNQTSRPNKQSLDVNIQLYIIH